jgi:hypothetical protein
MSDMSFRYADTDVDLPFVYRFTHTEPSGAQLEVGDQFVEHESFAADPVGQVGFLMMRHGLQLLGHSAESAQLICLLALQGDLSEDAEL